MASVGAFDWDLVDSQRLVAGLNSLSQDLLGWKVPEAVSMYGPHSHYPALAASCVLYLIVVFGLQRYIKTSKLDLRKNAFVNWYAFFHNIFMSLLSLYMFVDAVVKVYQDGGLSSWEGYLRVGHPKHYNALHDVFYWSKFIELIDTLILVVKQKELGFLHIFHHCTTASVSYASRDQPLWMGTWTNGLVHVFMYAHFARPMAFIRQYLTTMQIVQFLFVLSSYNYWWYYYTSLPFTAILWGDFCYGVYLVFFCKFFYENYIAPKKPSQKSAVLKKEQ